MNKKVTLDRQNPVDLTKLGVPLTSLDLSNLLSEYQHKYRQDSTQQDMHNKNASNIPPIREGIDSPIPDTRTEK